ncbi:unnamed protein product [Meloidogyne enterolobii]|uniref:Uncharacterized protein n=1 Tax=Meloidogyne enterolobii TaxID=390850 RepID=A0ACB0YJ77_MELEN
MQKNAILPDEERRYFSDLNRNVQDNDELNVLDNETKQKQHLEQKEILCYKVDRQLESEKSESTDQIKPHTDQIFRKRSFSEMIQRELRKIQNC